MKELRKRKRGEPCDSCGVFYHKSAPNPYPQTGHEVSRLIPIFWKPLILSADRDLFSFVFYHGKHGICGATLKSEVAEAFRSDFSSRKRGAARSRARAPGAVAATAAQRQMALARVAVVRATLSGLRAVPRHESALRATRKAVTSSRRLHEKAFAGYSSA